MKKLLIVSLLLSLLTGCAPALAPTPTKDTGRLQIVATVFPAYDFARAAAGDGVTALDEAVVTIVDDKPDPRTMNVTDNLS